MTNDSKLGLVAGIAAVLVVAAVYFQKPNASAAVAKPSTVVAVTPAEIVTNSHHPR